jgi:hypothetical protein
MGIKIFCRCGADITNEITAYDKETRTFHWFESNDVQCADCAGKWRKAGVDKAGRSEKRRGFLDVLLMQ